MHAWHFARLITETQLASAPPPPGPKGARSAGCFLLTVFHCSGHPDLSRPRKAGRQTAMAGCGAYDRIGNPGRWTFLAVSEAS